MIDRASSVMYISILGFREMFGLCILTSSPTDFKPLTLLSRPEQTAWRQMKTCYPSQFWPLLSFLQSTWRDEGLCVFVICVFVFMPVAVCLFYTDQFEVQAEYTEVIIQAVICWKKAK